MDDPEENFEAPYIDDELIPDENSFHKDFVILEAQLSPSRSVAVLVGIDTDTILIEATGFVLYEAYHEDTLIASEDVKMMAVRFDDFIRHGLANPKLDAKEQSIVRSDLKELKEEILTARDNMQNPEMN